MIRVISLAGEELHVMGATWRVVTSGSLWDRIMTPEIRGAAEGHWLQHVWPCASQAWVTSFTTIKHLFPWNSHNPNNRWCWETGKNLITFFSCSFEALSLLIHLRSTYWFHLRPIVFHSHLTIDKLYVSGNVLQVQRETIEGCWQKSKAYKAVEMPEKTVRQCQHLKGAPIDWYSM